jgi:hypothetical protein
MINYKANQINCKAWSAYPIVSMVEENDEETILQEYDRVTKIVTNMHMETQINKMMLQAWKNGITYGYTYGDPEKDGYFYIHLLDPDYCKVNCASFDSGVLGFLFLQKGDAKRLSRKDLYYFIIVAVIMASYTVADHLAIPRVGWYAHLLVSSVAMFLTSIIYKSSKDSLKVIFTNKTIIIAGIFYTLSEFFVIYASFNILPVSIVAVFLRLSTPIIMVISAVKYKEQDIKNQLGFGLAAIILALPIILG